MRRRLIALTGALGLVAAALAATAGIGSAAPERSADTKLSLVAYSTPREAYGKLIPMFEKTRGRQRRQLHPVLRRVRRAGARDQGRARLRHRRALARSGHGRAREPRTSSTPKWKKQSFKGMVHNSVVVFVVRDGNPKKIKSWNDLLRPDVEIITPNPFTSGGARWNIMAAYGVVAEAGQDRQAGAGEPAEALEERRRPGHERARVAEHVQQRQGRRAARVRERGVLLAHAGPRPAVGHPEDDDPDREPDRREQDERGQDGGERVPPLPADAGGAAGLRRLRLPARS